jgi:3'(2'), 5'-bisphosphate nucleotidase
MQNIDIQKLIDISIKAGDAILEVYNQDFSATVEVKDDSSPLTLADKASNAIIVEQLNKHFSEIPILSEEEKEVPFEERKSWTKFWCVDPLDGTKEFIKKNGQFTVNIALIDNGFPVVGIIYAPVLDILYVGNGSEAFKIEKGIKSDLKVNNKLANRIAVQSASHASEEEAEMLKQFDVIDSISIGSSLKFCMVAEGKADLYYRHGPTMEWDTAAGQAILEAAGGSVSTLTKERFFYNKENLRNGSFLGLGFAASKS